MSTHSDSGDDETTLDWDQIDSPLIQVDSNEPGRILSGPERPNQDVLRLFYSKMNDICISITDGGAQAFEPENFLIKYTSLLLAKNEQAPSNYADPLSLYRHTEECDTQFPSYRALIKFKAMGKWTIKENNLVAVAGLFDAALEQLDLFKTIDCCPQSFHIEQCNDIMQQLKAKILLAPLSFRARILAAMECSSSIPQDWVTQLTSDNQIIPPLKPYNNTGSAAVITQPTMPSAIDFREEHRKEFVNYVRAMISASIPLVVSSWHTGVKIFINNMWGLQQDIEEETAKEGWQRLPDAEILKFLEDCLPENAKGKNETKFSLFKKEVQKKKFIINFAAHDMGSAALQDDLSALQVRFTDISKEEGIPQDEPQYLIEELRKSITFKGLPYQSETLLRNELKKDIKGSNNFLQTINTIRRIVMSKIELQQRAQEFMPRTYANKDTNPNKDHNNSNKDNNPNPKGNKGQKRDRAQLNQSDPKGGSKPKETCDGCGWDKRIRPTDRHLDKSKVTRYCPRNNFEGCGSDERRNKESVPWSESTVGKAWKQVDSIGHNFLPTDVSMTLENAASRRFKPKENPKAPQQQNKGKYTFMIQHCDDLLLNNELIPFSICDMQAAKGQPEAGGNTESSGKLPDHSSARVKSPAYSLLLDTGALGSCVVSESFFKKLTDSPYHHTINNVCHELNTAMDQSAMSDTEVLFSIHLRSENTPVVISIKAIVAPIGVDLIIDKLTIKKYNLLQHYPSHFAEGDLLDWLRQYPARGEEKADYVRPVTLPKRHTSVTLSKKQTSSLNYVESKKQQSSYLHHTWIQREKQMKKDRAVHQHTRYTDKPMYFLATLTSIPEIPLRHSKRKRYKPSKSDKKAKKRKLTSNQSSSLASMTSNFSTKPPFEREGNLTEIPDNKLESIPAELISRLKEVNEYKKVLVEGSPLVQSAIESIVADFPHLFKATVQGTPAKLIPFKLEVDTEKWEQPANRLRCRSLDRERERELGELIKILVEANIIEACDAAYYSHAFLVPKPNGKWRLVLDFKNLNGATVNYYKWPLPDIREMLNRVGDSRPKFFAVFDLTSGYYQAEIDEESRDFTAFLTKHGIFRWLRLPMGLTGACSYFQKSLVTQVLKGLMHDGCELYLDDCMVHAPTLDIFLKRLRLVFQRFSDCGITLNPAKCKIGLSEVEFCGHTLNEHGLHFTRDKLDSVLNFPLPRNKRQIKSFLGLANYFRDHIENHSLRAQPLQDLVNGYERKQARHIVEWTDSSVAAFEDLRKAIDECPMLWFMDDFSPIILQTDASDYGIGAYLYQLITQEDGSIVERPIGFISKSIASDHQSWDTPMKEGFAIFYALKKWEYLLRDRRFTVKTDHKNLTQLRADHDSNKMVKRWFMAYQEYDIDWEYVKGDDNGVPDKMSRLCKMEEDIHPASLLCQLTGYEIPKEHWDTIARFHNSGLTGEGPGGHGGLERTLAQLDDAGLQWPHRTKHVRRFIRMCPCCQKMAQMKSVIHSYPFTLSTYGLWNTVSVDFIERLVPDKYGNTMIIVIIDNFSRFTDLYATNSTAAEGAADALLSFCGKYVTPLHFSTDAGANFKSKLMASLLERLGADHFLTTAYSKEQNAIVERQNKEVLRHLRNILFDHRVADRWSKYLPLVQRLLNTMKNSSTGLTPSEIVFPNGIQLDKSLLTESSSIFVSLYIADLQQAQARMIALAEISLRSKDEEHMKNYSPLRTHFDVGSYVLAEHRHNSLRRGPKSKLLPFLKGPMLVKGHNTEGIYALQDIVTGEVHDYHMSLLRPFLFDERTGTPLQAAVSDTLDEFVAEQVIRMRGNTRKKRTDLQFLIRWAGYGEADDTWEPWEYCKDSHAVQSFLRNHPEKRVQRLAKPIQSEFVETGRNDDEPDAESESSDVEAD